MCNIQPQIRKARKIIGKTLIFRDATESDAAFILSLRTDKHKAKYLSPTSFDILRQVAWLKNYTVKNDQAYFIIENKIGEQLGSVRLYDQQGIASVGEAGY